VGPGAQPPAGPRFAGAGQGPGLPLTRIIAGAFRGRALRVPAGAATRPTADRVRQALFDALLHAPWGGRLDGLEVLDAFAGTGALGLEALSRGAAHASFLERDRAALDAVRANVAACGAGARATVHPGDALRPPPGRPCALLFLDPPYGQDLLPRAAQALRAAGWAAPGALLVGELGHAEAAPALGTLLAERRHGAARVCVWRLAP
jgi:16S rRNA (guanine966-N2)-methyltransferase